MKGHSDLTAFEREGQLRLRAVGEPGEPLEVCERALPSGEVSSCHGKLSCLGGWQ